MAHLDVILPSVLAGVALLLVAAYFLRVPYPILLVVGGAGLGFVPGLPNLELKPELVLLILLPPLLYSAAFFSSLRDLQRNLRPISLLSIGLVLFTTLRPTRSRRARSRGASARPGGSSPSSRASRWSTTPPR